MFREDKSVQLAAYLINKAGGRLNYLTLIKMMYDADREMVLRWGTPIIYDVWVSMKNGPVLSHTYDEIKRSKGVAAFGIVADADAPSSRAPLDSDVKTDQWSTHIETDGYDVVLKSNPGYDKLSDAEIEMADKGFNDFEGLGYSAAIKRAHDLFLEWKDPSPANMITIDYKDLLNAVGQTDPEYLSEVRTHCQLNDLLAR
jgi:hypothetical protein